MIKKADRWKRKRKQRLNSHFPFHLIGYTEQTIACEDISFLLVCSALEPFQLMVAMWNSYHTACLPDEATSGGWAGGVSICLKSQMQFLTS